MDKTRLAAPTFLRTYESNSPRFKGCATLVLKDRRIGPLDFARPTGIRRGSENSRVDSPTVALTQLGSGEK